MTEVVRTPTQIATDGTNVKGWLWSGLDGDDSGKAINMAKHSDKTVHIYGTFDSATVTLYGSNDPLAKVDAAAGTLFSAKTASWIALTDAQGNSIAKTAAAIEVIEENPIYILPVVTGGGGSTAIKVALVGKRTP